MSQLFGEESYWLQRSHDHLSGSVLGSQLRCFNGSFISLFDFQSSRRAMRSSSTTAIALVGKLGHGKTFLLNKLTGTSFPSDSRPQTCTTHLQYGYTHNHDILVIDTPGFCASDDLAKHIAAQKMALEGVKLSGVFIVVKYERADVIAEAVAKIMDFVGNDNIRIIITNADKVSQDDGFDEAGLLSSLSTTLNLPETNLNVVGKDTAASSIEDFIESNLHEPRYYSVSPEQVAIISSLSVIRRKYNKRIDEVFSKIAAASYSCEVIANSGRGYETDVAISTTQTVTTDMVKEEKELIFTDAEEELTVLQQNLVYGKAGLALALRLREFMVSTNELLSWDVTNTSDPRNVYKKCNYCGAIFNKVEGCDGETICGAVPSGMKRARPTLEAEFYSHEGSWTVHYFWDTVEIQLQFLKAKLRSFFSNNASLSQSNHAHVKTGRALIESGCGATVSWQTMIPIDPALVAILGDVEVQQPGPKEQSSKTKFNNNLKHHEDINRKILDGVQA